MLLLTVASVFKWFAIAVAALLGLFGLLYCLAICVFGVSLIIFFIRLSKEDTCPCCAWQADYDEPDYPASAGTR